MDHETIGSEDWDELILNLEATIPVYDRINRFATIGQGDKWRRMVRERLPSEDAKILEVGCGPGSFAEDVSGVDLVCLDPSALMLEAAKPRVNQNGKNEATQRLNSFKEKPRNCPSKTIASMVHVLFSHSEIGMTRGLVWVRYFEC